MPNRAPGMPRPQPFATARAERVAALIRARFGTEFGATADGDRVSFDLVSLRRLIEALTATQSEGRDFERALAIAIKGTG